MSKDNKKDITIPVSERKIKNELLKLIIKGNNFYLKLNNWLLVLWRKYLGKQNNNRINNALRVLVEDPATALFINTVLLCGVSMIINWSLGSVIAGYVNYLIMFNIVLFCANKLNWKKKLEK